MTGKTVTTQAPAPAASPKPNFVCWRRAMSLWTSRLTPWRLPITTVKLN